MKVTEALYAVTTNGLTINLSSVRKKFSSCAIPGDLLEQMALELPYRSRKEPLQELIARFVTLVAASKGKTYIEVSLDY